MTHLYNHSDLWQPPPDSAPAALELRGVCVEYDGVTVLDDVSLAIPAGSLVAVIGPNGAGKTTLLKTLVGLVPRAAGQVLVRGKMLDRRACQVAYVPQRTAVNWRFPASVFDVVLMGRYGRLGWLRRPGPADRAWAEECLEQVGMLPQRNRSIAELSGGQQQRVFMARALAQEPEVLLLDEPISGVDAPTQEVILDLLAAMARAGKTLLLTTHDLRCSIERFDAMLCLRHKLIAYGSPTQVLTPGVLAATYGTNLVLADGSGATFVHA